MDKVNDFLVASGINLIFFDTMQAKQSVQQKRCDQNGTEAVGKSNAEADMGLRGLAVIRMLSTRILKLERQARKTSILM